MSCDRRLLWFALAAVLFLPGCGNVAAQEAIVIHDVSLIDGTGAPPRTHVDLVLRDGRIASIEEARTFRHRVARRASGGRRSDADGNDVHKVLG